MKYHFNQKAAIEKINADLAKNKLPTINPDKVIFIERGPYTVCQIAGTPRRKNAKQRFYGVGISKRNPVDPVAPAIGHRLALRRAVSDMVAQATGKEYQHNGRG